MRKTVLKTLFIAGILLFGSLQSDLFAQTSTSAQSGNYNTGSTWVGGNVPAQGNNIIIKSGHTVTLDVAGKHVHDITIETGAVLDNGNFDLQIQRSGGNPTYQNDGTHNSGSGNLLLFDGGNYTRVRGTGVSNINFIVRDYGIQPLFDCNLTINGNLQHHSIVTFISKTLIYNNEGGTITINGDIIPHPLKGITIINEDWETNEANITVNGNADLSVIDDFSGEGTNFTNNGTFTVAGDLIISPGYGYVTNNGVMTIGGDLLGNGGEYESMFINENGGLLKLGGSVFPSSDPGNLILGELNTVEYLGNSDQTIFNPELDGDEPYNNLIINNSNAIASIVTTIGVTNLNIKPGAALTVGTGGSLSVTGAFTIESDAIGTGSFISGSSISGNVERYIAGHNGNANDGWHLLSSPVSAQPISAFHTPGSGDFYKWDETTNTWINRTASGGGLNGSFEENFAPGRGYMIANNATDTKTFSGSIYASDLSVTGLTFTGSSSYAGWHLLGNPFSSALTWNNGNWALNNVDASAQIWNEANASYTVILPNAVIPAMNGFMVHASQNNASLTIPASARLHSNVAWYKSANNTERIVLTAFDAEGQTAQSTIIRFDANATEGYDSNFDSHFLAGLAPMFYSISPEYKLALNTLPQLDGSLSIPLGFEKNGSNEFTIELTETISGQAVYMTDLKTSETVNLTENSYTYSSAEGDNVNRFLLHFALLGVDEPETLNGMKAWAYDGQLYLLSPEPGEVTIYDLRGRKLSGFRSDTSDLQSHPLNSPSGVYIISFQGRASVKTAKVIVQ